jgi:hypothetical protein
MIDKNVLEFNLMFIALLMNTYSTNRRIYVYSKNGHLALKM